MLLPLSPDSGAAGRRGPGRSPGLGGPRVPGCASCRECPADAPVWEHPLPSEARCLRGRELGRAGRDPSSPCPLSCACPFAPPPAPPRRAKPAGRTSPFLRSCPLGSGSGRERGVVCTHRQGGRGSDLGQGARRRRRGLTRAGPGLSAPPCPLSEPSPWTTASPGRTSRFLRP